MLFEETRELDWACDGKVQQLKTDAKEALEQLRNDSAASNSTSLAASTDVLDCERVLEDLRVTPALAPEDLVNGDTGIQSLGILTEGQKAAHTFLQEGRAPLHATPKGLLLGHGYDGGADLSMMELVDCAKTDVLLLEPDRCYALVGSETYVPAGSIAEFELVEGSVPWRRRPQRDAAASVPPTLPAMEAHEGLLRRLFHALPEIDALLEYVFEGSDGSGVERCVFLTRLTFFVSGSDHHSTQYSPTHTNTDPSLPTPCLKAPWILSCFLIYLKVPRGPG